MKNRFQEGFQSIKPVDINITNSSKDEAINIRSQHDEYKMDLADKVLFGKKLTINEKENIYILLTGKEPPLVQGRGKKSTNARDIRIAIDFLWLRKSEPDNKKMMDMLRTYDNRKTDGPNYKVWSNNMIYGAINRGVISLMKSDYLQFSIDYDEGRFHDWSDNKLKKIANNTRELHRMIEAYIEEKEMHKKCRTIRTPDLIVEQLE